MPLYNSTPELAPRAWLVMSFHFLPRTRLPPASGNHSYALHFLFLRKTRSGLTELPSLAGWPASFGDPPVFLFSVLQL